MGGIEVTLLGQAFFQGLEVWFGDQKATTTTYWSKSSLICILPPNPVARAVAVSLRHQEVAQNFPMAKEPPIFKCIDDNEDKLIRTALSVLGYRTSGQMVDVSDLARRILNDGSWGCSASGQFAGPAAGGPACNDASHERLESQLLKVLDLIDLDYGLLTWVSSALRARGANPDARN